MLRTELIRPLPELLRSHASRLEDKIAFRDSRLSVSYADLELRTRRLAGHLADLRLQPGDRAAILLGNRVEVVESYLAILRAGAIGVPLNPRVTETELSYLLEDSGARVVITDEAHVEQVRAAGGEVRRIVVVGDGPVPSGTVSYAHLAATDPATPARDDLPLDAPAWMLYTSGTTGRPKGVLSSQRNCLWSVAACYVPIPGLSEEDRVLWPLPLFHSLSHIACVLGVTAVGATARVLDGFSADEVLNALREDSTTFLAGVPTMYHHLVRAAGEQRLSLPDLRMCLVGGAITTAALRRSFEQAFGAPLLDAYGSTETCGSITINWPTGARVEGSCGLPVPGLGVRLVDPETLVDVATGEEGEVWVQGPSVMAGYHDQPEATAAVFHDGWYRTGDLARRDESGYFTISGRIKELIIRGGENIHPGDVEAVLRSVPGVADAAVVGKPHEVLGEVPVAFLVPGPEGLDPEHVLAVCRQELSYIKVPEELYEIDRVPRTASGKITRHVLLDRPARLRAAGGARHELLFQLDWLPLPTVPASRSAARHWAVVGPDVFGVADSLDSQGRSVDRYSDADELVESVDSAEAAPEVTVLQVAGTTAGGAASPAEEARDRVRVVTEQAESWLGDERFAEGTLVVVTRAAVAAGPDDEVSDLVAAPVWGAVRALRAAHPGRVVLVDLDDGGSAAALAEAVSSAEPELLLRSGVALRPRANRVAATGGSRRPFQLTSRDTALVAGADGVVAATVARHLAAVHDVRRFLLVSRGGDADLAARELRAELTAAGASVALVACDVADRDALAGLLAGHRPAAVVFAAGAGREALSTMDGALNLHELTLDAGLKAFVLLSSAAGTLGGAGSADDAAAGVFLDAVARHRAARGLPALSVVFGPGEHEDWSVPAGVGRLTGREHAAMFDAAHLADRTSVLALRPDSTAVGSGSLPPALRDLIDVPVQADAPDDGTVSELRERLAPLSRDEQDRTLVELVRGEVARLYAMPDGATVPSDRAFRDLGLDSATAVQLRNRLTATTGLDLPLTLAFDHPTPARVGRHLRSLLFGGERAKAGADARVVSHSGEPIAIVAMGCRLPGGVSSPEELWDLVAGEGDAVGDFPGDRGWNLEELFDPDPGRAGKSYVRHGGFLDDVAGFDPEFFGISPREAEAMDPQQRLLLEVSWEVLERAAIAPDSLRGADVGVFSGVMYHDYASDLGPVPEGLEGYLGTGNSGSVASGRVSYTLGLQGPAVTVDTACSSSLVALHVAAQALRDGECELALAGGVAVMAKPTSFVEFSRQRALAPDGRCKAFAEAADGTAWAEGVGVLVLERLSQARRNGHQVLAVVRGSAVNQDGASNGLTAPSGPAQERVIRRALASAGLSAAEVDAVEAHGTGTRLGDPIEAQALLATYGQGRPAGHPLWLGSLKSNIGHAQAAAGVAGVIKVVQAMRHGVLPRTLHVDEPSSRIDWSAGAVELLREARPWPELDRPRRAAVSSFGVSGTNAHVILEHADEPDAAPEEAGSTAPVPWVLSARTAEGLRAQAGRWASFLADRPGHRPADVGFSSVTTRAALEHRAAVVATDPADAVAALNAFAAGERPQEVVADSAGVEGKLAMVFPGQGAQWAGMGAALLDSSPVFAARIAECEQALQPHVDWSLRDVLRQREGAPSLERVDVVQPVSFAVMVSLAELWRSYGIAPDAVVGHSQGEIAAACVAGALSIEDAAKVVALRSQAIRRGLAGRGGMMSVSLPLDRATDRLRPGLEVAAVNGPTSVVVAGEPGALEELLAECEAEDVRARRVPVDYASHTSHVERIREELLEVLADVRPRTADVPFFSTVDGRWLDTAALDGEYWYRNLRRTVGFAAAVDTLAEQGYRAFVEASSHPVLTTSVQEGLDQRQQPVTAVVTGSLRRDDGGLDRFLASLTRLWAAGVPIDWSAVFEGTGGRRVELPTQAFQHRRYWLEASERTGDVSTAGLEEADHPLVGAVVSLPESGGVLCTGRLSMRTHPWLADHAVSGTPIVPGAALVELAVRAGDQVGFGVVEELVIEQPLLLPATGGVRLQVSVSGVDDGGRRQVAIHSRADDGPSDAWSRHATGFLAATGEAPQESSEQWPPRDADPVDVTGFYENQAAAGYGYGPAFQGVRAAWARDEEFFAEVSLADAHVAEAQRFGLHPALLDAALHSVKLRHDAEGELRLPFAFRGVRLHASGASQLRVRAVASGPDEITVGLADPLGHPVASIESLVLRPAPDDELATGRSAQRAPMYRTAWTPVPQADGDAATASAVLGTGWGPAELPEHESVDALVRALDSGLPVPEVVLARVEPEADDTDPARVRAVAAEVLERVQRWLAEPVLEPSHLVVLTRGAVPVHHADEVRDLAAAAVWGLVRSAQSENPGRITIVDADRLDGRLPPLPADEPQLALRDGTFHAPRLATHSGELEVPGRSWRLEVTDGGDSPADLALVALPEDPAPLAPGEVRLAVRAAGVNFKDVLITLDMLGVRHGLGGEAAGVVLEVGDGVTDLAPGDRVMGVVGDYGAFATEAVTDRRLLARIPRGWSFEQAASVPVVFLTAYYGLRDLAGLSAGQSVLVHAAAGGVGMAATQLARHWGAEVFGTAGPGKWDALRSLGLTDDHIASSRTAEFGELFRERTGGRGVDVVLNSLTGELAETSLALLPRGGHFLELGKTETRDAGQVAEAHPGVRYQAYALYEAGPERTGQMLADLVELFESGAITPSPLSVWDVRRAPEAFRHISQARHVGKVVLSVPRAPEPGGTVLITGGTGTLGAETARHLVAEHGVRNLVLCGRQGMAAPGAPELAEELTRLGARVSIESCDVADRESLARLLAAVPPEHPLTGVVHTAGALDDGVISALDEGRIATVFRPKVDAALHLHELTADLDLAWFVLFSSASGVFGNPGQGNYAAANAFMDGLAQRRRAAGLPAVSLAWGWWAQTSALTAALDDTAAARHRRNGLQPMPTETGMDLLDSGLDAGHAALVPVSLDLPALRARASSEPVPPLLRGLVRPGRRVASRAATASDLAGRLANAPAAEQTRMLLELVCKEAAAVLGHATSDAIDPNRPFKEAGFDSLTAVEVRNRLNDATKLRLSTTVVFDYPTPAVLAEHIRVQVVGEDAESEKAPVATAATGGGLSEDPIAIVSIGCRFPGAAEGPEEFWRVLRDEVDVMTDLPDDRGWNHHAFDPDPDAPGSFYTRRGAFLDAAAFDAEFFGISPREAVAMDPQQRLLLEVAWETVERAGIDPTALRGAGVGVFTGVINHDYTKLFVHPPAELEGHLMTGTAGSVASGRIAYTLGLRGPALTVDTACSSSLVALHLAMHSLRRGECELAIAGGATLMATLDNYVEFSRHRGLAPDGRCKAFAAAADGTAWSEGAGLLLLERLSDARRNGHEVLAVLRGSAVNHDGASNGLTAPNGPAQQDVIRQALADAGLSTSDVDVVEAHGTGTRLGDPIEADALLATYGRDREADRPLWLGSVKSNIGHSQAAAGVAGVIKVVQAMRHGLLPRTLHVDEPSEHVDWSSGAMSLLTEPRPWEAGDRPRRAGVSSFGISGTNAHVVLEEAPADARVRGGERTDGSTPVPVPLSARSAGGLRGQAEKLAQHMADVPEADLADVAFSQAISRAGLERRAVVLASDRGELLEGLAALRDGEPGGDLVRGVAGGGGLALLFTGQGSQRIGMGEELHARFPVYAKAFDEICAALDPHLERPLREVVAGEPDPGLLDLTAYTQPALFAVETALYRLVESWGVRPDFVAGHSLGEIVAAHVSGVLSLEDAARLVAGRGRLIQALPAGGAMTAVQAGEEDVAELLAGRERQVDVAAVNSPTSVVVSGDEDAVAAVAEECASRGWKTRRLRVAHAFHSPRMDAMLDDFGAVAASLTYHRPRIAVLSNVSGKVLSAEELASPEYWVQHVRRPVRFNDAVRTLWNQGVRTFVELGPDAALTPMAAESLAELGQDAECVATMRRDRPAVPTVLTALSTMYARGASVDWPEVFAGTGARRVDLPTYAFQHRRYWPEVSGTGEPEVRERTAVAVVEGAQDDEPSFRERWHALAGPERFAALLELVRAEAATTLGNLESGLATDDAFFEVGFTSLNAVELRNRLSGHTGLRLPTTLLFEYPTPQMLAEHLHERMAADQEA
ncbi:ansamitocin polyketide synthase A [Saccharopolyspora erythraea NRRL 2338]|uniref:6-deoxyerythronolide-B synthase n=2 Tax=Saccharopolyspora erythraea TaxID=1836 RepID=A4FDM8_SACEN|nr:type I polyketide synthase [Saccharopolyspora erythraea]PFG95888.1 ansamitocin polyketide synthase A [Saccharopolyspora erythraea NRRL 2338]CAM02153.1 modular polyketide synthase- [Saccharopolyspora erythraea NRRL 2338]